MPKRRAMNYLNAHNRAVRMYQRSSIFILWAGIVNVFAALIGVIQNATNNAFGGLSYSWPRSGFALCLTAQIAINNLLLKSMSEVGADLLIMLISVVLGGAFAVLGFLASRGRKWLLFLGTGLIALDFGAMFFVYAYLAPYVWTNYAFTLAIHVLVLLACVFAIFEFYNVIHIEKVFRGDKVTSMEEEKESEVIASGE